MSPEQRLVIRHVYLQTLLELTSSKCFLLGRLQIYSGVCRVVACTMLASSLPQDTARSLSSPEIGEFPTIALNDLVAGASMSASVLSASAPSPACVSKAAGAILASTDGEAPDSEGRAYWSPELAARCERGLVPSAAYRRFEYTT